MVNQGRSMVMRDLEMAFEAALMPMLDGMDDSQRRHAEAGCYPEHAQG